MEENDKPNNPTEETPAPEVAQLLKILELQSAARQRSPARVNLLQGDSFRYGSLVVIVVFTFGSLGLLEWFLSSLPKPHHPASASPAPGAAQIVKTGSSGLGH
jgi:hypothetical protein